MEEGPMKATARTPHSLSRKDSYMALIRQLPLRPIRTGDQYARAAAMLDNLAVREDDLDAGESDYFDVLSDLIEAYDNRHHPAPADARTPLQRLHYLMQTSGTTPAALGDVLGSRPAASMIL